MKKSAARFIPLLLLLLLVCLLAICLFGTGQTHFDLPPDQQVRVILQPTPAPSPSPSALSVFRSKREQTYADMEASLGTLLASLSEEDDLYPLVKDKLQDLTHSLQSTLLIETALQGMGWQDALCAVQKDNVTVFFSAPIQDEDGALLCDLIREWTALPHASIRLIQPQ